MKRQLSKFQIVCITLLWAALCYIVLTSAERIDGPIILTLVISAALVFIPVNKKRFKRGLNNYLFIPFLRDKTTKNVVLSRILFIKCLFVHFYVYFCNRNKAMR